jgi:hypothetical protein
MGVSRVVSAALCMLCVCLVSASAARALITSQQVRTTKPGVFKKLNGGPDEFKNHALPSAVSIVTDSNSVMYPFDLRGIVVSVCVCVRARRCVCVCMCVCVTDSNTIMYPFDLGGMVVSLCVCVRA